MKLRRLCAMILPFSFSIVVLLSSCSAMAKSPISLVIDVNLTKDQKVAFSDFYEQIKKESYLQRDKYIISGIHVTEDSCVHGECDRRVWEIINTGAFSKQLLEIGPDLPKEIVYGEGVSGLKESIRAEPLKFDMPYWVVIGIVGINNDSKKKIYFSAHAHFMLARSEDGSAIIMQTGKNGVSLKRVIIK